MALSYSVSLDSVTVRQHAQHQDPETEAAKWNSAFSHLSCSDNQNSKVCSPFFTYPTFFL